VHFVGPLIFLEWTENMENIKFISSVVMTFPRRHFNLRVFTAYSVFWQMTSWGLSSTQKKSNKKKEIGNKNQNKCKKKREKSCNKKVCKFSFQLSPRETALSRDQHVARKLRVQRAWCKLYCPTTVSIWLWNMSRLLDWLQRCFHNCPILPLETEQILCPGEQGWAI
jgi:hypothetical protein